MEVRHLRHENKLVSCANKASLHPKQGFFAVENQCFLCANKPCLHTKVCQAGAFGVCIGVENAWKRCSENSRMQVAHVKKKY